MTLAQLLSIFFENGCNTVFVKELAANDNSKNQVYFGGNFSVLNIFPISEIINETAGDWKKERFKAKMKFSWIAETGQLFEAPNSQLILYPRYPEVRFSGFLAGCENAPSNLMNSRIPSRILFLGVTKERETIGFTAHPESSLAVEFSKKKHLERSGVFHVIDLSISENNSRTQLLRELLRIHQLDWIDSKRLNKFGQIIPCNAQQCGGYTLEAEFGITPNGLSEPDFLDWEIKQFGVKNFQKPLSSVITLMTPEPTDGIYAQIGYKEFVRKYGYPDTKGILDRMNFGGVYKIGKSSKRTKIRLEISGFDLESGKIRNTDGKILLLNDEDDEVASWSFLSLILHWNRKHNNACFVPSLKREIPTKQYSFSNKILLGNGTSFDLFLQQLAIGNIYYDPAIKIVDNLGNRSGDKPRSQFRIKSKYLENIYYKTEWIDLNSVFE
jgi:MvaI/BcnI restriction endonuclease family